MNTTSKKPLSDLLQKKINNLPVSYEEKQNLRRIFSENTSFIADSRFSRPSVMRQIIQENIEVCSGQSLNTEQEQTLFLQMNYAKYKLNQCKRRLLRKGKWTKNDVLPLLMHYKTQCDSRSKIVSSNMGLVLSMVQRVSYAGVEFSDLVSEGSMALLRSVEKFDCSRGFKFSTYACRAIFKGFSRTAKQSYRYRNLFPLQLDTAMEKDDKKERLRTNDKEELAGELNNILEKNLASLTEVELSVVRMRYPLDHEKQDPLTLKQVGETLRLTKERIRQIQNKALTKLKSVAEERLVPV